MLLKNFLFLHFLFFLMNYFYFCFILKLDLILNEIKTENLYFYEKKSVIAIGHHIPEMPQQL